MESKTYVFDGNNGGQGGVGSDLLTGAMLGGGGFGGFGGANWLLPFLLFALWGNNGWGNGFGFGNRGGYGGGCGNAAGFGFISDQLNNDAGRELIMQAIQGNATAISQLSSTLNCSTGEIRTAINGISTQLCNLGSQMGMNTMQVIQAINAGDTALQSQLAQCCCDLKGAIADSKYATERGFCSTNQALTQGFSSVAYETQRQTCDLQNTIKDSTQQILAGQAAIEKRELQREIATLQEEKQTYKLGNMIAAATNPILAEVESIKCKLPKTEVIPATPEYVPINRSINLGYAPCCGGYNAFGGWGWNGCQNGTLWG
jgi:hypothetical protein